MEDSTRRDLDERKDLRDKLKAVYGLQQFTKELIKETSQFLTRLDQADEARDLKRKRSYDQFIGHLIPRLENDRDATHDELADPKNKDLRTYILKYIEERWGISAGLEATLLALLLDPSEEVAYRTKIVYILRRKHSGARDAALLGSLRKVLSTPGEADRLRTACYYGLVSLMGGDIVRLGPPNKFDLPNRVDHDLLSAVDQLLGVHQPE